MKMKKIVMGLVMALFAINAMAANIKWWTQSVEENLSQLNTPVFANAPEQTRGSGDTQVLIAGVPDNATIDGVNYQQYQDSDGHVVEYGRIKMGSDLSSALLLATWIEGYYDENNDWVNINDWEYEYPETMVPFTWSQYLVGTDPDTSLNAYFELGYIDWDTDEFVSLAYASASIASLYGVPEDARTWHIYSAGSIDPFDASQSPWEPTLFHAVPEPSTAILALLGTCLLLKRRKSVCA